MSRLALLALALAGTAHAAEAPCAFRPGSRWLELESAHFVLATDLRPADADDLAEQLEVLRGAVLGGLFAVPPELPGRLRVVAFARVEDFRVFAPRPLEGFFAAPRGGGEAVVVFRADVGRVTRAAIVAHELTHAVVALCARLPRLATPEP